MDTPINAVIGHSKDKAAADRLTESCVSQTADSQHPLQRRQSESVQLQRYCKGRLV